MSSTAQIEANQANAQLSSGPRSPEGKARSSQNARKHGFTSTVLHLSAEDLPAFHELEADLRLETAPQGALEEEIFAQLLHSTWQLRRLRAEEERVWQNEPNPLDNPNKLNLITRYAARHERACHRALRELRALQTERALRDIARHAAPCLPDPPPLASTRVLTKQTQSLSRRQPSANQEIDAAIAAIDREADLLAARATPRNAPPVLCGTLDE